MRGGSGPRRGTSTGIDAGLIVGGILLLLTRGGANAAAAVSATRPTATAAPDLRATVPYCGIHCLYAASLAVGAQVPVTNLLHDEYVGCSLGSSLAELEKAATDNRLYAMPVANLTGGDLDRSANPIILHVKSSDTAKGYDHYVLFIGMRAGRALVLDPGAPLASVPLPQVLARWDGSGLIVSAQPIATAVFDAPRATFAVGIVAVTACVLIVRRLDLLGARPGGTGSVSRRAVTQGAGIAGLAVIAAFVFHLSADGGLLAAGGPIQQMERANANVAPLAMSLADVRRVHDRQSAVFVDARTAGDYAAGHIEGAINIPVDATDVERHAALSAVAKDTPVVIYCQSKGCGYARAVATALYADGYERLALFEGGWQEWSTGAAPK